MQKKMFEELLAENLNCVKSHRTVHQQRKKENLKK